MSKPRRVAGWICQPRDIDILNELMQSRAVTMRHLAQLYFGNQKAAAYKRLGILRRAGLLLVARRDGAVADSALVQITHQGYNLLREHGHGSLTWPHIKGRQRLGSSIIRHELEIMDVKVAFIGAIRSIKGAALSTFITAGRRLRQLSGQHGGFQMNALRPDAYVAIAANSQTHRFFLELDRSTQSTRVIQDKALSYRRLYRSGAFARALDMSVEMPERAPFRVLFVCPTAARRDSLAASMLTIVPPVRAQCIFTTLADVRQDLFGPIWCIPHSLARIDRDLDSPPLSRLLP